MTENPYFKVEETNVWVKKMEWLERIMESKFSHATKVFAFGIFRHAYGDKTESFPGSQRLVEVTGLSGSSHFSEYRQSLESAGAVSISKRRAGYYKQEHCVYEILVDWDGNVPDETALEDVRSIDTKGKGTAASGKSTTSSGKSTTSSGEGNTPLGGSKTSSNTSTNQQEDFKDLKVSEHASFDDNSTQPLLDGSFQQARRGGPSGGLAAYRGTQPKAEPDRFVRPPDPYAWIKFAPSMKHRGYILEQVIRLNKSGFRPDLEGPKWIEEAVAEIDRMNGLDWKI